MDTPSAAAQKNSTLPVPFLRSLAVSHYRSCVNTRINLQQDLSVLIGPNGSGKTNALNAILLLRAFARQEQERPIRDGDENPASLKAEFVFGDKVCTLTADMRLNTDANNKDVLVSTNHFWHLKEGSKKAKRVIFPLWLYHHGYSREDNLYLQFFARAGRGKATPFGTVDEIPPAFTNLLPAIHRFLSRLNYYSASQFTNPSECPVSFEVEIDGDVRRSVSANGHAQFLFDLYNVRRTERYRTFFSIIGPEGIGLVDKIEFSELVAASVEYTVRSGGSVQSRKRNKFLIVPQFIIGRNKLSPNQLSEGTFKTITLLFYLMTDESSAILIEEPEVCVHHGLLLSITELIKSYSKEKQIVISTHSDFILDKVEPRQVYKVSREDEGTVISEIRKTMSAGEFAGLKAYLRSEGNLGEYWRSGGLD